MRCSNREVSIRFENHERTAGDLNSKASKSLNHTRSKRSQKRSNRYFDFFVWCARWSDKEADLEVDGALIELRVRPPSPRSFSEGKLGKHRTEQKGDASIGPSIAKRFQKKRQNKGENRKMVRKNEPVEIDSLRRRRRGIDRSGARPSGREIVGERRPRVRSAKPSDLRVRAWEPPRC